MLKLKQLNQTLHQQHDLRLLLLDLKILRHLKLNHFYSLNTP